MSAFAIVSSGIHSKPAVIGDGLVRVKLTLMYGPTVRCKSDFVMDERSCINVFGLCVELRCSGPV